VVEADAVSVRNSNQKIIKKDLYRRQLKEKSSGYEAMIDPTEGALDLADTRGIQDLFYAHKQSLPVSMPELSLRAKGLSN